MRTIKVEQVLFNAWETWECKVPDACPTDEPARSEWVRDNPDQVEWENMKDSGFSASEITSTEEM